MLLYGMKTVIYVIGYSEADNHNKIVKFRIDRMKNLTVTDHVAMRKPKDFNIEDYFKQIFSMYDGEECEVELLCANELMKHIVDRLGEKVQTTQIDNKHFSATVTVSLSPTFYGWVFSFGGKMSLVSPKAAVDGFERMLIFRAATVAAIGILLSFIISSLIMYILFGEISEAFRYIDMVEVILPIIILFLTIIFSPLLSIRQLNKKTVIQLIND